MRNHEVAELLNRMGTLLEIKGENVFKIKAYYKAASVIEEFPEDIEAVKNQGRLHELPGIGATLEEKIKEYLETGKLKAYLKLTEEVPESLLDIVNIPSVGPKKAKLFFDKLNIKTVAELKKAAEKKLLADLPGVRAKTIENILRGIQITLDGQERMNLGRASDIAHEFVEALKKEKSVKDISVAGSLRRGRETIRDIDILIASKNPKNVMQVFVNLPQVKDTQAQGDTKASILTHDNVQVDVRVIDPDQFGAALLYFTGSKNFNIKLRQIAMKKDMKVSEYGVFKVRGEKETLLASKTEQECFKVLDLPYIPPELREDLAEAQLFSTRKMPQLVEIGDIRGDLHVHSTWSDGRNTIAEMARAAMAKGYTYLAISDHSPRLKIAGGVSVPDLVKKKKEIDELNKIFKNFRLLFGTEVEIDAEGNLDYNDATLSQFDVVIAAIHSGFEQSQEQLTARLLKVCQNKYVHAIAHPTGVHLGKRGPYAFDFEKVFQAARDYNVAMEINGFPFRLDLNSTNAYLAHQRGVKFVVNTDSHQIKHLDFMKYGVTIARRAWLQKEDVLNTSSLNNLMKFLKK